MYVCAQLYLTLCDPVDYSLSGSSVHEISQARILEWVAISSSRGSLWLRNSTFVSCVSCIGRWILYHWATWEAHMSTYICIYVHTHIPWGTWEQVSETQLPEQQSRNSLLGCWCHNGSKGHTNWNLNHKVLGSIKSQVLHCLRLCERGSVERGPNLKSGTMASMSALTPMNPLEVYRACEIPWRHHSTSCTRRRLDTWLFQILYFQKYLIRNPKGSWTSEKKFPLIKSCPSTEEYFWCQF